MQVGMLWLDNDVRKSLYARIDRAADYYRSKYGEMPDICLVHPSMLVGEPDLAGGHVANVSVRPNLTVLPGCLWIGREEKN
jgi:hypothetical protein